MSEAWQVRELDEAAVAALERGLSVHPVTARCLAARGVTSVADGRAFLEPRLGELRPPTGLAGLDVAVDRLSRALEHGETIGVFGDYDVDGVTTTALVSGYLRRLGARCVARVARRDRGYGFAETEAEAMLAEGCSLVITGDCGTSDVVSLERLRAVGVDSIVIDHHTVPDADPSRPHPATALINPFRADSAFPFRGLASVGLGFYVMAALRSRLRAMGVFARRSEPDLRAELDLVALGTVADLVPLQQENRILTFAGIAALQRTRRPGLLALMECAKLGPRDIDERAIGFKLGPRLNAPGRLGDSMPALELLLAETDTEARARAAVVEQANDRRRAVQEEVTAAALAQLGDRDPGPAVVVAGHGWPSGVVGIVAARLVERYRRPAFVIAVDEQGQGRGSCRSYGGVDLYATLSRAGDLLLRYGGHAAAAGLTIEADLVDAFRERVAEAVGGSGAGASADPGRVADAEIDLAALDDRIARELASLAPFGKGNDEPTLLARGVKVRGSRRVGDGSHLRLDVIGGAGRTLGAIGFGLGPLDPGAECRVDLLFRPVLSSWGGRTNLELQVQALGRVGAATSYTPARPVAATILG